MEASSDSHAWVNDASNVIGETDGDEIEAVISPEEILEEALGELDQLDAAMLQLAPRKCSFKTIIRLTLHINMTLIAAMFKFKARFSIGLRFSSLHFFERVYTKFP